MSVFLLGTGLRALMHRKLGAQVDSWGGAMLPASFAGEEGCSQGMCQAGCVFLVHTSLEQPQQPLPLPQSLMGDGLSLRSRWGFNTAQASLWALSSRGRHRLSPSVSGMEVLIKRMEMGCGNGPCRGSRFYSQQPHGGSQPSIVGCRCTCIESTHTLNK